MNLIAFVHVLMPLSKKVLTCIRSAIQNRPEAEDLTQEIFILLWQRPVDSAKQGHLLRYLIAMTRSRAIDKLRSRRRRLNLVQRRGCSSDVVPPAHTLVEQAVFNERSQQVRQALAQLSEQQRQGILAVQNLVAPPTGKIYRLWAIADGEKIPCGTLKINPQGKVLNKF